MEVRLFLYSSSRFWFVFVSLQKINGQITLRTCIFDCQKHATSKTQNFWTQDLQPQQVHSLKRTASWLLKMDGWKMKFSFLGSDMLVLGRVYVSYLLRWNMWNFLRWPRNFSSRGTMVNNQLLCFGGEQAGEKRPGRFSHGTHKWRFPKMVVPNNYWFNTKNDHFVGVKWGYHHFRKHPNGGGWWSL